MADGTLGSEDYVGLAKVSSGLGVGEASAAIDFDNSVATEEETVQIQEMRT